MEYEGWPEDDAPLEDAGERDAAAEPETDDPFADLDEATRARVEGAITQREQAAAARAQQEAETRFRRASGRWGHAAQVLGEQIGLTVDDRGNVATADPAKLAQYTARFLGGAAAPAAPAEEPEPYDIYNPDRLAQQVDARTKGLVTREVEAATKPLLAAIERLTGAVGQQAMPNAAERARPFLRELGQEELADTPEFQQVFQQTLNGVPMDQWQDPAQIDAIAGFAMAHARRMRQAAPGAQRAPAPTPRQLATQASRAGLQQIGGSRDTGARPQESQYGEDELASLKVLTDAGLQMSPEEFRAASAPPGRDGRSAYYDFRDRRNKRGK